MADRRSPKGIPLLSLKMSTPSVPQLIQTTFSEPGEVSWFGNVGPKRYFLGTQEAEGLSDEDLYRLFLKKESELVAAKNSKTPFQYVDSEAATYKLEDKQKDQTETLQRVKEDARDASYEAWAAQMTSLVLLKKEEQRNKQTQQ